MYKCTWCGEKFCEEDAALKALRIRIHGEEETEAIDVCPYCGSEEIVEIDDEVE